MVSNLGKLMGSKLVEHLEILMVFVGVALRAVLMVVARAYVSVGLMVGEWDFATDTYEAAD